MTETFFVLEAVAEAPAEFALNGIPIMRRGADRVESFAVQVNHLLVAGANRLEITIFPGPIPSLARWGEYGPREMRASVAGQQASMKLCRYPFGATVGGPQRTELGGVGWVGEPGSRTEIAFTVDSSVDLGPVVGRWRWQDGEDIELDASDRTELCELLERIAEGIAKGDPGPFLEASTVRLEDLASVYSTDPAERAWMIRRGIALDVRAPGFAVCQLDPREFDFRVCAGGKMVECVAKDWQPIVRAGPDAQGNYSFYDMFAAKLDGKWAVVR